MSDGVGSQRRISTKCAHNAPWETTEKLTAPVFDQKAQGRLAAKRSGGGGNEPAALHPGGGGGIAPSSPSPYSSAMRFSAMPLSFAVSMMAR